MDNLLREAIHNKLDFANKRLFACDDDEVTAMRYWVGYIDGLNAAKIEIEKAEVREEYKRQKSEQEAERKIKEG